MPVRNGRVDLDVPTTRALDQANQRLARPVLLDEVDQPRRKHAPRVCVHLDEKLGLVGARDRRELVVRAKSLAAHTAIELGLLGMANRVQARCEDLLVEVEVGLEVQHIVAVGDRPRQAELDPERTLGCAANIELCVGVPAIDPVLAQVRVCVGADDLADVDIRGHHAAEGHHAAARDLLTVDAHAVVGRHELPFALATGVGGVGGGQR